ncbi:MAG: hypothetical protein HY323_08090 [Betaproteobacteria bacterium]|nr:hypothetical protein [Betaproteobacteria bacterium]
MKLLRSLLDRLPTPVKVALWLAASGVITQVLAGVTDGTIELDATWLAIVNLCLVTARELLDQWKPTAKITGATP